MMSRLRFAFPLVFCVASVWAQGPVLPKANKGPKGPQRPVPRLPLLKCLESTTRRDLHGRFG